MKIKHIVMLIVLLAVFVSACSSVATGPELTVTPENYDFGRIKAEEGVVSAELKLQNSGSKELEILAVSTSCGCTTVEVDKEVLKPKEEANLKIEFDPNVHEDLTGLLERVIYIRTNNPDEPETQIKIQVEVLEGAVT